jgi:hypothetical protein
LQNFTVSCNLKPQISPLTADDAHSCVYVCFAGNKFEFAIYRERYEAINKLDWKMLAELLVRIS